jgi:flagellar assembly factor FliW
MRIRTINFGELEIQDDKIIDFPEGIPGFPELRRFVMLELEDVKPFQYLQAIGEPAVALLVINPFLVDPGYRFDLTEREMEEIRVKKPEEAGVYAVVTVPSDPSQTTMNLMAPILINERQRRGKQVILQDSGYSFRHPFLGAVKSNGSNSARDDS